jgi:hypothetical protein
MHEGKRRAVLVVSEASKADEPAIVKEYRGAGRALLGNLSFQEGI